MKRRIAVGLSLMLGAPAYAAAPRQSEAPAERGYKPPYTVEAIVVATDPGQDTITFRAPGGVLKTARVAPDAAGALRRVKPGQHLILVCRDAESADTTLVEGLRKKGGGTWKRAALTAAIIMVAIFPKGY